MSFYQSPKTKLHRRLFLLLSTRYGKVSFSVINKTASNSPQLCSQDGDGWMQLLLPSIILCAKSTGRAQGPSKINMLFHNSLSPENLSGCSDSDIIASWHQDTNDAQLLWMVRTSCCGRFSVSIIYLCCFVFMNRLLLLQSTC